MQPTHLIRIPQLAAAAAAAFSSTSCHRLLKVGDVLKQSRRFTDADVVRYSAVSGDQSPIHLDADFSPQIADRSRIVHGLLVASLFPSLIAFQFPGAVYASQSLQFTLPVYIGDEVVAEVKATNIRASKEKYYVKWATKCYTSKECLVLDGEATTILPEITLSR